MEEKDGDDGDEKIMYNTIQYKTRQDNETILKNLPTST